MMPRQRKIISADISRSVVGSGWLDGADEEKEQNGGKVGYGKAAEVSQSKTQNNRRPPRPPLPEANNHRSELDEQPLSIDFANPSPTTDYSPRSKIPITTHQAELLQRSFAATIFVC
jgi:hypothetical protein